MTQFFTHEGRREKDAAHDTGDSVGDLQDSRKAPTKKRQGVVDLQRSFFGQVMPSCGYQKKVWISDIIKISSAPSCSHAKEPPNYKNVYQFTLDLLSQQAKRNRDLLILAACRVRNV